MSYLWVVWTLCSCLRRVLIATLKIQLGVRVNTDHKCVETVPPALRAVLTAPRRA